MTPNEMKCTSANLKYAGAVKDMACDARLVK